MRYPLGWEYNYDNANAIKRADFTHINLIEDPTRSISIQVIPANSTQGLSYDPYELSIDEYASRQFTKYGIESKIVDLQGLRAIQYLNRQGGFTIFHYEPNFQIYINDASKIAERGNFNPVNKKIIEDIVSTFKFVD